MQSSADHSRLKQAGLWMGPIVALSMFITAAWQDSMPHNAWLVAGVCLWMAIWWSTEAIPVAAAAFIPLVLSTLQVMPVKAVAQAMLIPLSFYF